MKTFPLLFILSFLASVACAEPPRKNIDPATRFSKEWPDADDLKWFKQAKGKTEKEILKIYGKPMRKEKLKDGGSRWFYPWTASAFIDFTSGNATQVFYTAGF